MVTNALHLVLFITEVKTWNRLYSTYRSYLWRHHSGNVFNFPLMMIHVLQHSVHKYIK